jgi:hypothetical protein
LSIDDYISQLESIINSFPIVTSYNLIIDRKTREIAFISGKIDFRDGSILDFKEFIEDTGVRIEKYKYAYNYRKGSDNLFRYDNAPDPRAKKLMSFPDHKHSRNGELIASVKINLFVVLGEIEGMQIN